MSAPSRVAIIAGAGGAGAAVARELAGDGMRVVVLDARPEAADAAVEMLAADGLEAEAHGVDLLDVEAVTALRDDLLGRLGSVDVLVHLVGGWRGSPTLDLASVANWNALNPPIVGTLATLTAVFAPDVRAAADGRVVMVTSTAVAQPTAGNIAYVAAKAAAESWMAGVAHYLRDSSARSVVVAVHALLTDAMAAAEPDREWPRHTHVHDLAAAVAAACRPGADAGEAGTATWIDLTAPGYSTP